jgi:uncharacterized RDD family membrane protein YckC
MTAVSETGKPGAAAVSNNARDITTPEGVLLRFELASRSERATALIIDLTIMFLIVIGLVLTVIFLAFGGVDASGWALGIGLLLFFALRNFYFTFFELRWHGVTPGKRALRIRVIDRNGGRLRPESVFARNLMREVELFLPLTLVASANSTGAGDWSIYLALIWASIFTLMPLFNRDHMRAGDIVGGTWVIRAPRSVLMPDMTQSTVAKDLPAGTPAPEYSFAREQLAIYGIYELQTLETVLRRQGADASDTHAEVCKRIQRKIGWKGEGAVHPKRFLEAFYTALRGHLENRMLLGERRESKQDRNDGEPGPE